MRWGILDMLYTQYSRIPSLPTCDLSGQIVLIVGANTGIGLETAKHLARMGPAKVILGCRDGQKAVEAKRIVEATTGFDRCELGSIDLADFSSVVKFVETFNKNNERLDMVVCNAAMWTTTYETTVDGWEKSLQVNYLSSTLLVILLIPVMLATAKKYDSFPRIVVVGSESHYMASLPPISDDCGILATLNDSRLCTKRAMIQRYAVSKLLAYFFVKSLTNRLSPSSPLSVTMPLPGFCRTSLFRTFSILFTYILALGSLVLGRSIEQGGRIVAWTAIAGHDDALEREKMRGGMVDNINTRTWEESDFVLSLEGHLCERALWNETVDILSHVDDRVARIVETAISG